MGTLRSILHRTHENFTAFLHYLGEEQLWQDVFKMGFDDHKLVPLSEEDQKLVEEVRGENSAQNRTKISYPGSWVQLPTEKDPQHEGAGRRCLDHHPTQVWHYMDPGDNLAVDEQG